MKAAVKNEWMGRAAWLTAAVLALGMTCGAQSDESLGDVARQNKPAHKAAHVVTNDEIPSAPVSYHESSVSTGASDNKQNPTDAAKADAEAKSKPSSSPKKSGITVPGVLENGTMEQARATLETLKHDRQAFITNYEKIQRRLNETDNDALRQSYMDVMATRDSTLAKNAKQIAETENAIQTAEAAGAQGGNDETK